MLCLWVTEQLLSVIFIMVMSQGPAGDQGLFCTANSSFWHRAMYLGKPAIIPLADLGNLTVSLTMTGRVCVFNAASAGASGKPAVVSKGPHKLTMNGVKQGRGKSGAMFGSDEQGKKSSGC